MPRETVLSAASHAWSMVAFDQLTRSSSLTARMSTGVVAYESIFNLPPAWPLIRRMLMLCPGWVACPTITLVVIINGFTRYRNAAAGGYVVVGLCRLGGKMHINQTGVGETDG